jgi:hypothetical protein
MKKSLLMFVIFFSLVACFQKPGGTVEPITPAQAASATALVSGMETALAASSPTPWVEGTQTALAVASLPAPVTNPIALPTFAFTPVVMEKPTDFSPVLYGGKFYGTTSFLLLGGVSKDAWLAPEASVGRFSGEATYSLHTLSQKDKYFLWGKTPEFSPVCKSYSVGTDATLDEIGMVGVLDGWNVEKRAVTDLSADGQFYQQVVIDWLMANGVAAPRVGDGDLQIFRVDLEGDGTDEIFISETHLDESQHTTQAGDYSIVLMRKVEGNEAKTVLVAGDVYRSQELEITFPKTYSIANFVDLNQDGVQEVLVDIQKWEGFGASVYQVDDQAVTQTLSAGCGL